MLGSVATVDMPDLLVRITPSSSECPATSGDPSAYTCLNPSSCTLGTYDFAAVPPGNRISASLEGHYAVVRSCKTGAASATDRGCAQFAVDGICFDCVFWGAQDCPTVPPTSGTVDLLFSASAGGLEEYRVAQVNAFNIIEGTHDWFQSLAPQYTGIDKVVPCGVNAKFTNHAYWYRPVGAIISPSSGNIFRNSAMNTIVSHEYGHFIFDTINPERAVVTNDTDVESFHEGVGDTVAALYWNAPLNGENYYLNGDPIRDVEVDVTYYGPAEIHARGDALAGAFWDLRHCSTTASTHCAEDAACPTGEQCTDEEAERLFADFLFITDGVLDGRVILEILAADSDSDGDFSNGITDHSDAIRGAFAPHGWSDEDGADTVKVSWNAPEPPVRGGAHPDYVVDDSLSPPRVSLITTVKNGVPIHNVTVGRVTSTTPTLPLDIWAVTSDWQGAENVTVQIGDPLDPSLACADVGFIDISRGDSSHWSDIQLEIPGMVAGNATVQPSSSNLGGRISGNVGTSIRQLTGYAVGSGEDSPGALITGCSIISASLTEHPSNSTITTGFLEFAPGGGIQVEGEIAGPITLKRNSAGDIHANGVITGDIGLFEGLFNGDICGNNLQDGQLPSNIKMLFGPGGTICRQDACADSVPRLVPETNGVDKNRYISFSVPSNANLGDQTAICVFLDSLHRPRPLNLSQYPAPDFSSFEGQVRWVNSVEGHSDLNCEETNVPSISMFKCATLGCAPEFRDWGADLYDDALHTDATLHVSGSEIVPSSEYSVFLVQRGSNQALCGSPPLMLTTARWGDVVAPFQIRGNGAPLTQPNVSDLAAEIDKFKQALAAPVTARCDIAPDYPNNIVNIADIQECINAFQYRAYPFSGPSECP